MLILSFLACGSANPAFYTDPLEDLEARTPGEVLRYEAIATVSAATIAAKAGRASPHGAAVYRVLYATAGLDGPDVASARVAVPTGDPPAGGFPIVAHLHGTVGLGDDCAPSRKAGFGFESSSNPIAARMIAAGRVVVEPDYLGLGTPGPHPYVAREPTGNSVLDAIRAAAAFEDPDADVFPDLSGAVALEGHSQGGHAVLATLSVAGSYAPELDLVAAVAIAPPGAPAELLPRLMQGEKYGGFVVMALAGWSAAHPELGPLEDWLADAKMADRIEERCLAGLTGSMGDAPSDLLRGDFVAAASSGDWEALGLSEVVAHEDLGGMSTEVPLLVVHGTDDPLLPHDLTAALVDRIAANGSPAELLTVDGGDHLMLPHRARDEVTDFLDDALAP